MKFSSQVQRHCNVISFSFITDECKKWTAALEDTTRLPLDSVCLLFQLVACTLQQSPHENFSSLTYQEAAEFVDLETRHISSLAILQRRVYACFWFKCEGRLKECREAISGAYQQAFQMNLGDNLKLGDSQSIEMARRIWFYLIAWDQ
jgi:hypothetical protein